MRTPTISVQGVRKPRGCAQDSQACLAPRFIVFDALRAAQPTVASAGRPRFPHAYFAFTVTVEAVDVAVL